MQANISLIFNLLLLAGVIFAIFKILRKQPMTDAIDTASKRADATALVRDDVIAVRKIEHESNIIQLSEMTKSTSSTSDETLPPSTEQLFFLVPNKQASFQGYDLLQSLLSAKLRFGEGNFFHFYQQHNGKTESLFTVTAASESGEFDINKMQGFSTRGLCLFIKPKQDKATNEIAMKALIEASNKLSESLDAILLDENQKPFHFGSQMLDKETAPMH